MEQTLAANEQTHPAPMGGADWDDAEPRRIVSGAVASYAGDDRRIQIDGPSVQLSPKAAICLSLALREPATNAVKPAALSNESGTVRVAWTLPSDTPVRGKGQTLTLDWTESGGPPVEQPLRDGFGLRPLKRGLPADLDGVVDLGLAATGLSCRIVAPLEPVSVQAERGTA